MKKLTITTSILAVGMMTGGLWAQNPNIINKVQDTMNAVQQKKTDDSNAALGITSASSAKPAAGAPAKPVALVQVSAKAAPVEVKNAPAPATANAKPRTAAVAKKPVAKKAVAAHPVIAAKETKGAKTVAPTKIAADDKTAVAGKSSDAAKAPKPEEKKWAMSGKRDPFFSPVVQEPSGSGCSTGKKCLEIGQINLRGVVKSEGGFIAVVTNSLNKAYFLRENDPVFNGYVVRITGDTVVFQETVQDKLGKALTREVTKKIYTPAV
jgi:Tfp pilus assembly protein PilP